VIEHDAGSIDSDTQDPRVELCVALTTGPDGLLADAADLK